MKPTVLDASAVVEYLLRSRPGLAIESLITGPDADLHVPSLCDVEVCAALRRSLLQARLNRERAEEVLADYRDLPLSRHGHLDLLEGILGLRENFSAYDAAYVVLAGQLGATLVTCDGRLARAVAMHFPEWTVASPQGGAEE